MDVKIKILKGKENNLAVFSPHNPRFVENIKTIKRRNWHPEEKYWVFPSSNGTPEKILEVLGGGKIHINPSIQFEDLRRELVSKKTITRRLRRIFTSKEIL